VITQLAVEKPFFLDFFKTAAILAVPNYSCLFHFFFKFRFSLISQHMVYKGLAMVSVSLKDNSLFLTF